MQGDQCPYDHGLDPVVVDDVNLSTVLPINQGNCTNLHLDGMIVFFFFFFISANEVSCDDHQKNLDYFSKIPKSVY